MGAYSLLNEAREFSEEIIAEFYSKTDWKKKPRTYREKARKAFLAIVKQRRPSGKVQRREIKQQLQYLRRNLRHPCQFQTHFILDKARSGRQGPIGRQYASGALVA